MENINQPITDRNEVTKKAQELYLNVFEKYPTLDDYRVSTDLDKVLDFLNIVAVSIDFKEILDEHDDIESLLKDDYNLENDIIKNMQHLELKNILNSLTDDEFNLIKVSYLTPNLTLYKYCTENNLNYHKKRRQLLSLLSKIKTKLL